jgi:serine/threonine-protein phosphatase PP1 catalytic subunit
MCPVEDVPFEDILDDPFKVKMLSAGQISRIQMDLRELLQKEPALVRLNEPRPAIAVGDTHGDLRSTISMLSREFLPLEDRPYLIFLGDYVDRGPNDIANLNLISMLKTLYPDRIVMLRGNHESEEMNRIYGFYHSASNHPCIGEEGFKSYQETFAQMPLCVLLQWNRVFGVHGGIPFDPHHDGPFSLGELKSLKKTRRFEDMEEVSRQMLWGDPRENISAEEGYEFNFTRGMGWLYGRAIFDGFIEANDITLVVKSHQRLQEGHQYFFEGRLLSILSTKYYSGYEVKAYYARISAEGEVELVPV